MPGRSQHSLRVLHAAVVFALAQGAVAAQADQDADSKVEKDKKAAEVKLAQAEPRPATPIQLAQAAPGAPAEQIVVTARRREELIQDVPASVSAFSGRAIEQAGIQDVTGLADLTPNTTLKTSRATNTTLTAFIRGIGQQDPVAGFEQGVGIYLDDVYLARPQGALQDIYDLERIEILRGPQGTLYGRNTIGGAVKYVSKKLSPNAELNVKVTLGNYDERDLVVRGNLPVTDTFRMGATVATFNREGFGKNVVNGLENYNKDVLAGRVSAEFTPTSSLFVRIAADRTQDDSLPRQGHRLTPGPAIAGSLPPLPGHYDTRANLYTVLGKQQEVTTEGQSLLVDYALSQTLSFKSITAHRKGESIAPIDFDSLNQPLFEAPAIYRDKQTSQEFQLTYTGSRWQGVAGLYYMKSNAFNEFDVLFNALVPQGLSLYTLDDFDTKATAIFADVTYNVTRTFDVSVGGRYTDDKREARIFKRNYLGLQGSPTLGNPSAIGLPTNTDLQKSDLSRTDTKFTPRVGFSWKFTPGHNFYGVYAEGFKGGLFDPRMDLGGNPNSLTSQIKRRGVEPEEVSSYELGLKSAMYGGRLQTNAAIFYMDYKNVQIPGSIPTFDAAGNVTGFAGSLSNAGKAKVQGLELEAIARVTDRLSVTGMLGLIDAQYKEWIVANGLTGAAAALINIAGANEFQNTPKTQASITGTYEMPLNIMGRGGNLAIQGTASYKSKVYFFELVRSSGVAAIDLNVPAAELLSQDTYTLVDASLLWTSRDRKITAGVVGRNLGDKRYKVAGYPFAGFHNTISAFYGDPRTVKFVASVTF
jgi:iron complex outermembrane recepter protein